MGGSTNTIQDIWTEGTIGWAIIDKVGQCKRFSTTKMNTNTRKKTLPVLPVCVQVFRYLDQEWQIPPEGVVRNHLHPTSTLGSVHHHRANDEVHYYGQEQSVGQMKQRIYYQLLMVQNLASDWSEEVPAPPPPLVLRVIA